MSIDDDIMAALPGDVAATVVGHYGEVWTTGTVTWLEQLMVTDYEDIDALCAAVEDQGLPPETQVQMFYEGTYDVVHTSTPWVYATRSGLTPACSWSGPA